MDRNEELARLIREQQEDMRQGNHQWPQTNCVSLTNIEGILDQDGHDAMPMAGGRRTGETIRKLKTASYVPYKGCRKYPKEHGARYMREYASGRRCGACSDEYEKIRTPGFGTGRGGKRAARPRCGHPADRQKQRYRSGYKNGTQCLECMMLKARERRGNG